LGRGQLRGIDVMMSETTIDKKTRRFAWRLSELRLGRVAVILVPMLWLAAFFFIPFLVVFKISLAEAVIAIPPYSPLLQWDSSSAYLTFKINFGNYLYLFESRFYLDAYLSSLKIAAISTFFALLIGFPIAYLIARSGPTKRIILLALVILPFWTSFLLRVYAWMVLLKKDGLVNDVLMAIGIIDQPLQILQTEFAVYLGIVYTYLPFMILPLYTSLEKMDLNLIDAAQDLGAKPYQSFFLITLPLAKTGIIAGCLLVFIPGLVNM